MNSNHVARRRRTLSSAALAVIALALLAVFGGTSRARAAAPAIRPVCGAVPLGHSRCFSWVKGNALAAGPDAERLRPRRPAVGLRAAVGQRPAAARPSRSSTRSTTRRPSATSAPTGRHYGLPPCTTANGCFRKVNQTGGTLPMPPPSAGWGLEISLDLDMVSAVCPNCHILLVEATTNLNTDLYTAVDTAARLGANAICNSYGGAESSSRDQPTTPTSTTRASRSPSSSGDNGYGVSYPAASRYVTAVGGTSLTTRRRQPRLDRVRLERRRQRLQRLRGQAGAGRPTPAARRRTVADVSAVADPNTGVAVYDSYATAAAAGSSVGGTSASSPIIAGVYALAGNASSVNYGSLPVLAHDRLFDVTTGSNGTCCARVPLHRRGRLRRPDRARHAERRHGLLAPSPCSRVPARPGPSMLGWQRPRPMGRCGSAASPGTTGAASGRGPARGARPRRAAVLAGRLRRRRRLLRPLRLPDHRAAAPPGPARRAHPALRLLRPPRAAHPAGGRADARRHRPRRAPAAEPRARA